VIQRTREQLIERIEDWQRERNDIYSEYSREVCDRVIASLQRQLDNRTAVVVVSKDV
jgi:hypothetical protein